MNGHTTVWLRGRLQRPQLSRHTVCMNCGWLLHIPRSAQLLHALDPYQATEHVSKSTLLAASRNAKMPGRTGLRVGVLTGDHFHAQCLPPPNPARHKHTSPTAMAYCSPCFRKGQDRAPSCPDKWLQLRCSLHFQSPAGLHQSRAPWPPPGNMAATLQLRSCRVASHQK